MTGRRPRETWRDLRRTLVTVAGFLLAAPVAVPAPPAAPGVVVVLVRHAEKDADGTADPGLSPAGKQRAQDLARLLAHAGVTHLFSSEFRRTRETLAPLAERVDRAPRELPAADIEGCAGVLRALPPGSVAVVAGHSNTIPQVARALGADPGGLDSRGYLPDAAYDRIFLLMLPPGRGSVAGPATSLELRYGDASPPPPGPR